VKGKDASAILGRIDGSNCSNAPTRAKLALIEILRALFEVESKPIIEPLNRRGDASLSVGNWHTSENGTTAPLFLKGYP